MKKSILILLFCTLANLVEAQITIPEFGKFVKKQFNMSPELLANCDVRYISVLVHTDITGKINKFELKKEVSPDVKGNLAFLKGYKFPQKYAIKGRPVLFFMTIDKVNFCPDTSLPEGFVNRTMREPLLIIKKQLTLNPKTVVIYETIEQKVWRGSVN